MHTLMNVVDIDLFTQCQSSTQTGESLIDHRQYWRKFSGSSAIDETTKSILARVEWKFASGKSPVRKIPNGELPASLSIIRKVEVARRKFWSNI
jgi:hypothetical protein